MDAKHNILLLLIEAYELSPNKKTADALKQFLETESLHGSTELQSALTKTKHLLNDWKDLDEEWYRIVHSLIG